MCIFRNGRQTKENLVMTNSRSEPWSISEEIRHEPSNCRRKKCHCNKNLPPPEAYDAKFQGLKTPGPPLRLYCYEAPFVTVNSSPAATHGQSSIAKVRSEEDLYFGFLSDNGIHYGGFRSSSCAPNLNCAYGSATGPQARFGAECWAGRNTASGYCPRVNSVPAPTQAVAKGTSTFVETKPLAMYLVSVQKGLELLDERLKISGLPAISREVKLSIIKVIRWIFDGNPAKVLVASFPTDKSGRKRLDDIKRNEMCLLLALPYSCREGLFQVGVLRTFWKTMIERAKANGHKEEAKEIEATSNLFAYRTLYPDGNEEPVCVDFSPKGIAAASTVIRHLGNVC